MRRVLDAGVAFFLQLDGSEQSRNARILVERWASRHDIIVDTGEVDGVDVRAFPLFQTPIGSYMGLLAIMDILDLDPQEIERRANSFRASMSLRRFDVWG
jgi:hypothetical protein